MAVRQQNTKTWWEIVTSYYREIRSDASDTERIRHLEDTLHSMSRCQKSIDQGMTGVKDKITRLCHNNEISLLEIKNQQSQAKLEQAQIALDAQKEFRKWMIIIIIGMASSFAGFGWWIFRTVISELQR